MSIPELNVPRYKWKGLTFAVDVCLHFLFPEQCPVCGKLATPGCDGCIASLALPLLPRCPKCGRPYPCSIHKGLFPLISGNFHEGLNRSLILELKYRNNSGLGKILGRALAKKIGRPFGDYLVPVPLHKKSRRRYNQAALIAEGISEVWGEPVKDVLSWHPGVSSQVFKSQAERRLLPSDAVINIDGDLKDRTFVLIDDVSTTGSTLTVCEKAISRSGGHVIGAITWTVSDY